MISRNLISTKTPVSLLGYGVMRMPVIDNDPGNIDPEKGEALIDLAYKEGITYYDTAYVYHDQKAEAFLGKALSKYPRDSYNVATKLPVWALTSEEDVEKYFFEQLDRLQMEYIDFYLVHSLDRNKYETCEKYHAYEHLLKLKEQGYIKHLGFSFHDDAATLKRITEDHNWDFAQIQMNYFDWDFQDAKGQYELLEEKHIPTIIMEPVRGGVLANLSKEAGKVLDNVHSDRSYASWAIQFAASKPNILCVLSGMQQASVLYDNVKTINELRGFNEEEQAALNQVVEIMKKEFAVPCTACGYCHECPMKVRIPEVFSAYNAYFVGSEDPFHFYSAYSKIPMENRAAKCIACGKCETHCPQQIKIPKKLQEIQELVDDINARKTNYKQM